jgi:hypothetical protein
VIYDTTGKAVRVVKYDTINSLKISDLTAGIYFIKFKGDAKTINTKFIIV